MKSIFTVHAGEFITGDYLQRKYKGINIWIPTADTGIDLLLSDKRNKKTVSIQVKFSRDYLEAYENRYIEKVKACGWWTLNPDKIKKSNADFWVFVLHSYSKKPFDFVIIKPIVLYQKLKQIESSTGKYQHYLWVMRNKKCWATRGFTTKDKMMICQGKYRNKNRDFSEYLNNWQFLKKFI